MAKRLRPKEITIPDQLWMDRSLSEAARHLWCFLRAYRHEMAEFTFRALCQISGLSHNTLVRAIKELEASGWLHWCRTGLRSLDFRTVWQKGKAITLPTDLLQDRNLPRAAKWIWGVIRRLKGRFSYNRLMRLTGYSRNSLIKYLRLLQESGWLSGSAQREMRRKEFGLETTNPPAAKRQREVELMRRRISVVASESSLGQALLFEVVHLLVEPGTTVIQNGRVNFMENPGTGGLLQYDLYLSDCRLALEFQGPQHARPTERFPGEAKFRAQQERDQMKREFSQRAGINLGEIWRENLSVAHIRNLLVSNGVPLRQSLDGVWHLLEYLEHAMDRYRSDKAA